MVALAGEQGGGEVRPRGVDSERPRLRLRHLLLIAVCVHLLAVACVYVAGRGGASRGTFGEGGVASFASDGRVYLIQISGLEKTLKEEGLGAWLRSPAPVHVKLYSLSFAALSPLFGLSVLSAEPLNLLYYLAALLLVYTIGSEVFGRGEGLLAASMFAAQLPSYLLHTTQLLKDPLFVVLALILVLVSVRWLTSEQTLTAGVATGLAGGAAGGALWLVRDSMWWVALAIMLLGAAMFFARQARRRTVVAGNLAGIALTLAIALSVSQFVAPYKLPREFWAPHRPQAAAKGAGEGSVAPVTPAAAAPSGPLSRVAGKVAHARSQFIELYPDAGSNVDAHVQFRGMWDVVGYLPRAVLVGLCAPFPNMWWRAGEQVGAAGRLLSGAETLLMYVVVLLALECLWRRRRSLPVWLLALVAAGGVTALGMVVVNAGALYRMRYLFWILLIIMGADAAARALPEGLRRRLPRDGGPRAAGLF